MNIENPFVADKTYWKAVNSRQNGHHVDAFTVRGMLHQESLWGSRGGASVATETMIKIMQEKLNMTVACSTLTPDDTTTMATQPFGVDLMVKPPIKSNEDLTDELVTNPDYIQYMMLQMNGSDVTFANYWVAGAAAIKAREEMKRLQEKGEPILTEKDGTSIHVSTIPQVIFCNHSLPARVDDQLSQNAATLNGNRYKPMDPRRADYQAYVYTHADSIVVWTDAEKVALAANYPEIPGIIDKTHKITIPVSYDAEVAHALRKQRRKEYFKDTITDDTTILYFQGRLVDYKHPEQVMTAFKQAYAELTELTGEDPDIACLIAGDGPLYDMLVENRTLLPEHIQKKISLPGRVGQYDGHAAGDICIVPSEKESFGLTGVEAAMTGNALIANNIGTIAEANGPGGYYVSTPDEYSSIIVDMILNPAEKARRIAQLQEYTMRYNPDTTAEDLQKMMNCMQIPQKIQA